MTVSDGSGGDTAAKKRPVLDFHGDDQAFECS